MILSIFKDLANWFFKIKDNLSLKDSLIPFITGIGVGFILCVLVYILYVFVSFKKNEKKVKPVIKVSDEELKRIINNSKNRFMEESSMKSLNQKFNELCEISWEMIQDIASCYYPDSKYPIYELSAEEFLLLNHYITDRVDTLLSGRVFSKVKKVKLSTVFKLIDAKKKYDENKAVSAMKKANVSGIKKVVSVVLHSVNPFHWIKKVAFDIPFIKISNKIAITIIDIISEETINVYSKSVFRDEDEMKFMEVVKEVEEMLGENYEEESYE